MPAGEDAADAVRTALARGLRGRPGRIRVTWLPAGVLALEGEVGSLAEKRQAGELARDAADRIPVDNALDIGFVADGELEARASAALHGADIASLGVYVEGGIAHLGGRAEGLEVVRKAREVLSRVPGIRGIRHDRVVLHMDREREALEHLAALGDWEILAGVRHKLEEGLPVQAQEIVATCRNAVVTLTGVVGRPAVRQRAETLARTAFGVEAVRNLVMDRESPPPRAEGLEDRIIRAIGVEGEELGPADIQVHLLEDVAYLLGTVEHQEAAWLAQALAREEPGVKQVFDHLTIKQNVT